MSASSTVAAARRHATLRWIGAPLLVTGLLGLVTSLLGFVGGGPGLNVMLGLFSTGMALASFGSNNDTALALALQARDAVRAGEGEPLPQPLLDELNAELARDRKAVLELKASPTAATVLPFVAVLVQSGLAWRLFGG